MTEALIVYAILVGMKATSLIFTLPGSFSLVKMILIALLVPIEVLLYPIAYVYSKLNIGIYYEVSIMMTEEDFEMLSDEINDENENDE